MNNKNMNIDDINYQFNFDINFKVYIIQYANSINKARLKETIVSLIERKYDSRNHKNVWIIHTQIGSRYKLSSLGKTLFLDKEEANTYFFNKYQVKRITKSLSNS